MKTMMLTRARAIFTGPTGFVSVLFVLLLIANAFMNPLRLQPGNIGTTLGLAAPLILAALASTPAILSGGGGIDISIGPMMGLINVILVSRLFEAGVESPVIVIAAAVGLGALLGAVNGSLVAYVRLQPIVATLATYLVFTGLAPFVMPTPGGSVPEWVISLSSSKSIIPVLAVGILWWVFRRFPLYRYLMATGGSDRAAYTAGLNVAGIRMLAYSLGGAIAGLAALQLTSLISSGDPNIGPPFTLKAIAAAALGGVSLVGGRGGLAGAAVGALVVFLVELALTAVQVSSFALHIMFGAVLVVSVVLNAVGERRRSA